MKICVIHVNCEELSRDYTGLVAQNLDRVKRKDTEIVHKYVAHLRRASDTVLAFPILLNKIDVVQRAVEAQAEKCDAVLVACSGDPGVTEARTLLDIPMIGPMEAALHLAAQYGRKIGIVTALDPSWAEYCETMADAAGLASRLAGVESIDIPSPIAFTEGFANPAPVREAMIRASHKLVARGANVIVLGSAGLSVMASNTGLAEVPDIGVPILDTISVGLKFAELRVDLTKHLNVPVISRVGMFEKMDEKNRRRLAKLFELGWDAEGQAIDLLTDEERSLQESVRRFMLQEVEPLVRQMEADGEPPRTLFKRLADLGFLGTFFSEEDGGSGGSYATRAIVSEETARVCAGLDLVLFADVVLFGRALMRHGTPAQKEKYLRPVLAGEKIGAMAITEPGGGSDALCPATHAKADGAGFVLKGQKTFITNAPIADFILVIARTSEGRSRLDGGTWFIVERGMEGLATGKPFDKLGMRSSPTGEVFLDNVRLRKEHVLGQVGEGFRMLVDSLDTERVLVGASTVGQAQGCLDEAVRYANEREVFGVKIRDYQLIQEKIANMATGLEMSRCMLYRLLRALDRGERVTREAAILKFFSSQMLTQASSDMVQIWGGAGQLEDNKTARFYRDGKHHEIGAGTNEIMKVLIARETYKAMGYRR